MRRSKSYYLTFSFLINIVNKCIISGRIIWPRPARWSPAPCAFPFSTASTLQACLKHLLIYEGEQFLHPRELYELSKMLLYTAYETVRPQTRQSGQRKAISTSALEEKRLKPNLNRFRHPAKRTLTLQENVLEILRFFFLRMSGQMPAERETSKRQSRRCFYIA